METRKDLSLSQNYLMMNIGLKRIEIVQEEEGYRLYAKDVEILVLKASEYISKKKRIVARGLK